jgi:hypothetical protein
VVALAIQLDAEFQFNRIEYRGGTFRFRTTAEICSRATGGS